MIKKAVVTMDLDGHFLVEQIDYRERCLKILKSVEYGSHWEDLLEQALDDCDLKEEDLMYCHLNRFAQFLEYFSERGRFEVVEFCSYNL